MHVPVNPYGNGIGSGSIMDANGNTITNNGNGTFTDTLGVTALTIAGSGSASSPISMTYPVTLQSDNATTASASVSYHTYTVQTNFQCSGISEYGAASVDLVDHITLADGSTYTFSYEATPGGGSGVVTGRLASIVLPTGGLIAYTYSQGCSGSGINTDGTPATLTRTLSGGATTYARTISGALSTTNRTDEYGKNSSYAFTSNTDGLWYETERRTWQGATSGTPLQDRITKYNGQASPAQLTSAIAQMDVYEQFDGGSQTHLKSIYDPSSGLLTQQNQLDPANNDAVLTATTMQYNSVGGVTSSVSTDGASPSHTLSSATYGYDETTVTATSGIPQHASVSGTRGNQTSAHVWTGGAASNTLDTSTTYYDTGAPKATTTPNGTTQYSYDSTQTFTTQTTLPTPLSGVSLSTSASYDQQSGVPLSLTGMNSGQTTQVTQYDRLLRPLAVSQPNGGVTSFVYYGTLDSGVSQPMGNNQSTSTRVLLDSYGRKSRVAIFNGQASNQWYQMDFCYNNTGQVQFQPIAYQGTGYGTSKQCSGTGTNYAYDALGRVTGITTPDGTTYHQYSGRAEKVTDVNGVQRITQRDLLGRISAVCEISSNTNLPSSGLPGNCGMDIAGTGFLTTYTYDLANHKTTILQGVQTRSVTTDAAGRTTNTVEPERGQTIYTYAYNGTGLVTTRQRPRANQTNATLLTTTTTQYDSLGRVVSIGYDDQLTPTKYFGYDAPANWAEGQSNLKGLLAYAHGSVTPNWAGTIFSYDLMGNPTQTYQCLPSGCGSGSGDHGISTGYDLAGNLTSEGDGASGNIVYGRSPAGEITSITNQSYANTYNPPNLVSNVANGPNGPISYTLGNGLNIYRAYDSMGRSFARWVCTGAAQFNCNTQLYGTDASRSGDRVTAMDDTVLGPTSVFGYDEFNRLSSTTRYYPDNRQNNFTYSYDRYGNRWSQNVTQGSGPSPNLSFEQTTNRVTSGGYAYDAAGNLTSDGTHSYRYDAEGNILAVDNGSTAQYAYDALNHRIRAQTSNSTFEYVYDFAGRHVSRWNVQLNNFGDEGRIYWDGLPIAFRSYDGTTFFEHQDILGTERMRTNYQGQVAEMDQSLPFGDGYSTSVPIAWADQDTRHFGLLAYDAESNTDNAQFRQYAPAQGRWMSPDPYDGSMDLGNPQSLNRYSYVLNNPLSLTDPLGLATKVTCVNNPTYHPSSFGDTGGGVYTLTSPFWTYTYTCTTTTVPDPPPGTPTQPGGSNTGSGSAGAPSSTPYMYVRGIGMIGPSPPQGCDYVAKTGNAAMHAFATGFGDKNGTPGKLLSALKGAAPAIGTYSGVGATVLGLGEAAVATVSATLSGAAEAIGGSALLYGVGSGILDFYKQLADPSIGCTVANP